MTKVQIHVRGERRSYDFPADMPPNIWSGIVQTAINSLAAAEVTRGARVRSPMAYVWATMERYAAAWRSRTGWPEAEAKLGAARKTRAGLRSVLDSGAAVQEMQRSLGQSCWPQLRAVTGHEFGHPASGPGACAVCLAAAEGDWPAFSRLTGLDAISLEHAYRAVRDARLVPETPMLSDWRESTRRRANDDWEDDTI